MNIKEQLANELEREGIRRSTKMYDLSVLNRLTPTLTSGCVFFAETTGDLESVILGGTITKIEEPQGGNPADIEPTHIALIEPYRALPGYHMNTPVEIWESTIYTTVTGKTQDGPQINSLAERCSTYGKSGRLWVAEFAPAVADRLKWNQMVAFGQHVIGKNHYNILELPGDLAAALHLPFVAKLTHSSKAEVCSEFVLQELIAGGYSVPFNPFGSNPEEIAGMGLFSKVTQIWGEPAGLRGLKLVG